MKIKASVGKHFFRCFDEARGIAVQKNKVLKEKNSSSLTYSQIQIAVFVIILFVGVIFMSMGESNSNGYVLGSICFLIGLGHIAICIASVIGYYNFRKKCSNKPMIIDEKGIVDESFYGIKMMFEWKKVKGIVVSKNTITILTDTPIYFYFDRSKHKDIIELAEKYNVQDKLIY